MPVSPEPADVVDQHVQTRVGADHLGGQTTHLCLGGNVGGKDIHGRVARRGADVRCGRGSACLITAGDADPGTQCENGLPGQGGMSATVHSLGLMPGSADDRDRLGTSRRPSGAGRHEWLPAGVGCGAGGPTGSAERWPGSMAPASSRNGGYSSRISAGRRNGDGLA